MALTPTTLETLPTELRILLLKHLPSPSSLRALTLSSPTYMHTYLGYRSEIYTHLTLRHLHTDPFTDGLLDSPRPSYCAFGEDRARNRDAQTAIDAYYDQVEAGVRIVKLGVEQCEGLLSLLGWDNWVDQIMLEGGVKQGNMWMFY
ncbi:MAG: hypothetical protein HETSPECPRED_008084 [Heterodermia speciosa]|uniref:F-box domain-containing protein n=1 Tax=Heterodermia speciosa TaxID=116794 RepID=A0A8H3EQ52_9LECA|nr:MAG: hypothetical protein HETSPECPRED_008084 [Heterodermia speciosa]